MPNQKQSMTSVFHADVADHKMVVIRDDGLYRHLRFAEPGTSIMAFDLITWPGHLCYTGDMGSYLFARVPDMFEFFRKSVTDNDISINPPYWAEKCLAEDVQHKVTEYSEEKLRADITAWLDDIEADDELREAVADEVLAYADDEGAVCRAVSAFEHEGKSFDYLDDLFIEADFHEYTSGFLWCLLAIVWGIYQYDVSKSVTADA